MTKQEVIDSLVGMLGPLGPFVDPAQREEEEVAWAAHAARDATVMIELLDLARNPATADERGRISEASFQSQLAHVLTLAGASAPTTVLDGVGPLTQDPRARATASRSSGRSASPTGCAGSVRLWTSPVFPTTKQRRLPAHSARSEPAKPRRC